ncbi:hypothetical protein [Chryseobacterium candidae]|uniref:Uncharacterized protein n=1 Tax=Chryseobacterium candidae TaxID=1978493 RepID=A0ABY2R297_9FLAO|nr:hypothetical protein [Chryseobacterium candidae]THV56436.1 hypothetical protein EK417_18880 [Chryseobacterium candidae]
MQKIDQIQNNLALIKIYDRHTLEKFMLGKNITVFDENQNSIEKVKIIEHYTPITQEISDAFQKSGFLYVLTFNIFNGKADAKEVRIINYVDFIDKKNNYSEILLADFKKVLSLIEQDLEDYVLDNSKTNPDNIKDLINNKILAQYHNSIIVFKQNYNTYEMVNSVFKDPVTFFIDIENMKKMSLLFNKAIASTIEKYKKYIDKDSAFYKKYKEEHKFILKSEKKNKKKFKEKKHEDNIEWKDIFKEKSVYKQFIKYAKKHIINRFIDYSFIFQKMKHHEIIHNYTHFKYIDWLRDNNFITDKDYEEFVKNAGFRSLSKSSSEQRENNFNNIFNL